MRLSAFVKVVVVVVVFVVVVVVVVFVVVVVDENFALLSLLTLSVKCVPVITFQ